MGQRGEKKNKDLGEITILWNWCLFQDTIVFETQVNYTYQCCIITVLYHRFSNATSTPQPPPSQKKANKHILVFQRKIGLFNFQFYWTHH